MGGWRGKVMVGMVFVWLVVVMVKLMFDAIVYEVDHYPRKPQQETTWHSAP